MLSSIIKDLVFPILYHMWLLLLMFPFSLVHIGLLCLLLFLHVKITWSSLGFCLFLSLFFFFFVILPSLALKLLPPQFHPVFVFITTCPIHCTMLCSGTCSLPNPSPPFFLASLPMLLLHFLPSPTPPYPSSPCLLVSQSSQSQSRGYAKPWLAHSKTPTPTKCQSCPEHGHAPGHEVTHCLPSPRALTH